MSRPISCGVSSFRVSRAEWTADKTSGIHETQEVQTMYDMYPDWGPASHHPDNPRSHENVSAALQASLDLRDNGGQRPDDN